MERGVPNYVRFYHIGAKETTGAAQIKETTAVPPGKSLDNMKQNVYPCT